MDHPHNLHTQHEHAKQVSLEELKARVQILSLHTPQTPLTKGMVNKEFLGDFAHPIWLINTARGSAIVTEDLVEALQAGQVLGAGLDVLEYEKASFENGLCAGTSFVQTFCESFYAFNIVFILRESVL